MIAFADDSINKRTAKVKNPFWTEENRGRNYRFEGKFS